MTKYSFFDISAASMTKVKQAESTIDPAIRPTVASSLGRSADCDGWWGNPGCTDTQGGGCITGQDSGCSTHQMRHMDMSGKYRINTKLIPN